MKETQLRQLIKECVKSILEMEDYDPKGDTFSYAPRDRDSIEEPREPDTDSHGYNEKEEIRIITLARDYALKAGGSSDQNLQQNTLSTIAAMLTRVLEQHGQS